MSGRQIRLMDPQHLHLRHEYRKWDLTKENAQGKWTANPDQKEPWKVISYDYYYNGH